MPANSDLGKRVAKEIKKSNISHANIVGQGDGDDKVEDKSNLDYSSKYD